MNDLFGDAFKKGTRRPQAPSSPASTPVDHKAFAQKPLNTPRQNLGKGLATPTATATTQNTNNHNLVERKEPFDDDSKGKGATAPSSPVTDPHRKQGFRPEPCALHLSEPRGRGSTIAGVDHRQRQTMTAESKSMPVEPLQHQGDEDHRRAPYSQHHRSSTTAPQRHIRSERPRPSEKKYSSTMPPRSISGNDPRRRQGFRPEPYASPPLTQGRSQAAVN